MTTYGPMSEGFVLKTQQNILDEMVASLRAVFGADFDTSAESVAGQVLGVVSLEQAAEWETLQSIDGARDPAQASHQALDSLAAITGTTRRAATFGAATLTLHVAANSTVPAGSVAAVSGDPANRWITLRDAVNATGAAIDVTLIPAIAATSGRFVANHGTITVIATPVTGWLTVNNPNDATPGLPQETDAQLRLRRAQELFQAGSASVPSLAARLLASTANVRAAVVTENASPFPDAAGRPPHTFEAVVQLVGGTLDQLAAQATAVAQLLWANKAAGIDTYGAISGTITDALGVPRKVSFTLASAVNCYFALQLEIDPSLYAGDDAAKAALLAYGTSLRMGRDVVIAKCAAALADVAGVTDVLLCLVGRVAPSTVPPLAPPRNLVIGETEAAAFDTSRMSLTTTVGSP